MREFRADLHIHTCLSPCASLDMTPRRIVAEAVRRGIDVIAITDHNSAENVRAVQAAARGTGLVVIPGMEVTTAEEVHVVALFATPEAAESLQATVFEQLLPGENDEELFGIQVIANELDEVEGINPRLLIGATGLGLEETVRRIQALGGLAVAAHIDRNIFSVISQLGFIPGEIPFDALEVSGRVPLEEAPGRYPGGERVRYVTASDAHELDRIGASPLVLRMEEPSWEGLWKAVRGEGEGGSG